MVNGKSDEAIRIIKRAARINRANMKDVLAAVDAYTSAAEKFAKDEEHLKVEDSEETIEDNGSTALSKPEEGKFIEGLVQTNNPGENATHRSENISISILDILRNKHTRWRAVFTWYLWWVYS